MPKPRQTCTQCSLRRQKCDRKFPCSRCVQRGIPDQCTLSWPKDGGSQAQRMTPRQQTTLRSTPAESPDLSDTFQSKIAPGDNLSESDLTSENPPRLTEADVSPLSEVNDSRHDDDRGYTEDLALNPDHPPWENDALATPENASVSQDEENASPPDGADMFQVTLPDTVTSSIAILELQLPSLRQIWSLVDYHEMYLLWYHGCYHGPTFRGELDDAINYEQGTMSIESIELQWMALLFSIMAGSMACATDRQIAEWGFWPNETSTLSKQWYKATITCLHLGEYTLNHRLSSVQAITTLSMSAHTLGFSDDLSVFLGAALKIARSLGLDRLQHRPVIDNVDEDSTSDHRQRVLRREVGRRVWSQLCIQDWFSIPFSESQCISLTDFVTTKPSNRNHVTMAPLVESFPTYVSYGNFVFDIAKLVAEHHTAMARSSTPFTKYQRVSEYDTRMRSLARKGLPQYFQATTPINETWPEFIPWARRSLTISFAHKIMMIHRKFIKQSFTNSAFQGTRVLCIAASKTILKEVKYEQEDDGPVIWIDQAFCITAGMILCLDIIHRRQNEAEYEQHSRLVEDCVHMLQKFKTSVLATRGAKVLLTLLAERKNMAQPYTSRKRKRTGIDSSESSSNPRSPISLSGVFRSLASNPGMMGADAVFDEEPDLTYRKFVELFPPQAGFSNNFLFGDLLDFSC